MDEIKRNEETINIENLINYLKKNKITKSELLYLINLYRVSKDVDIDDYKVGKDEIFKLLKSLNDYLKESDDTPLVLKRIDRELTLLEETYEALLNDESHKLSEIYYKLGLLSYEAGTTINPNESKKILSLKIKGEDKDAKSTR